LALVKSVEIYELTHCVYIDALAASQGGGIDDSLPDFLVDLLPDIDRLPDTLFSSNNGETSPVFVSREWTIVSEESTPGETYDYVVRVQVTLPNIPDAIANPDGDWQYFRFDDPVSSSLVLTSVVREDDGSEVLLGFNAWRTAKTKRFVGVGPVEERFFHLFDFGVGSGIYELRFGDNGVGAANLVAEETETTIRLSWTPEGGAEFFDVLQKFESQPESEFRTVETNLNVNEVTIFNLSPAKTYTIQVRAGTEPGQFTSATQISVLTAGETTDLCGNGILDNEEACDDGNLVDGDCCSSMCTIEGTGTVCRASSGDCDVDDFCDGVTASCPSNAVAAVGVVCGFDEANDCSFVCTGTSTICPTECAPDPVTLAPITLAPITPAPVTQAPITPAPITAAPITPAPITPAPVTPAPITPAPITPAPVVGVQLALYEILPNPINGVADTAGEYIVLTNPSLSDLNLNAGDYRLCRDRQFRCKRLRGTLPGGGFLVVCRDSAFYDFCAVDINWGLDDVTGDQLELWEDGVRFEFTKLDPSTSMSGNSGLCWKRDGSGVFGFDSCEPRASGDITILRLIQTQEILFVTLKESISL